MISIYLVVGVYLGLFLQLNYIPNKNDYYGKTNFIHDIIGTKHFESQSPSQKYCTDEYFANL